MVLVVEQFAGLTGAGSQPLELPQGVCLCFALRKHAGMPCCWAVLCLSLQGPMKKGLSRVDKQMRRFADIRRLTKSGHAVKISVEGNRMPLWFFFLLFFLCPPPPRNGSSDSFLINTSDHLPELLLLFQCLWSQCSDHERRSKVPGSLWSGCWLLVNVSWQRRSATRLSAEVFMAAV